MRLHSGPISIFRWNARAEGGGLRREALAAELAAELRAKTELQAKVETLQARMQQPEDEQLRAANDELDNLSDVRMADCIDFD